MNNLATRVWMTAILMTFGWLGTTWLRAANSIEVKPLRQGLDTLPTKLDGYEATEVPLDDHILEVLKADALVNRHYVRADRASIMCHVSAWLRPDSVNGSAPHVPKLCYTNAGWDIVDEKTIEIDTPSGKLKMNLLAVKRNGDRSVVAYWYQLGDTTFTTSAEAKQIHRKYWGKKNWPPLVKVLLDSPAPDINTALPRIEKFATSVFAWTDEL